jgi:hypothetical protein
MAAATVRFYTHEAVEQLLLKPDAANARVEGRLSKMEQLMQQQQEKETYVLNRMNVALDLANTKLEYLDKALERARLPPPARASLRREGTRPGGDRRARCVDLIFNLHKSNGEGAKGRAQVEGAAVGTWRRQGAR